MPLPGAISLLPGCFFLPQPHHSPEIILGGCKHYTHTRLSSVLRPALPCLPSSHRSPHLPSRLSLSRLPESVHTRLTPSPPSRPHSPNTSSFPPICGPSLCSTALFAPGMGSPPSPLGLLSSAPPPGLRTFTLGLVWPPGLSHLTLWAPATLPPYRPWSPCSLCPQAVAQAAPSAWHTLPSAIPFN